MPNPRWSASRLASIGQCKVAYKNTYMRDFVKTGGKTADVLDKGTCAHEVCEWYDSSKSEEHLRQFLDIHLEKFSFDKDKYDLRKMIPRFLSFWRTQVKAREESGFRVVKEGWKKFKIGTIGNWVGALDLVIENDESIFIFDYKTGGTAKLSEDYQRQLMIYALAKGYERGWDFDRIVNNIQVSLFFPIASLKDEEQNDPELAEKMALKSIKTYKFKKEDLEELVRKVELAEKDTKETDWDKITGMDGSIGFYCQWCDYIGSVSSQCTHSDFTPCECTYKSGLRSLRGVKFLKKSELPKNR